jgi:hypothetical protein
MDHLAVARGDSVADAARRLDHDHTMTAKAERARNGEPDDTRANYQDVYGRLL